MPFEIRDDIVYVFDDNDLLVSILNQSMEWDSAIKVFGNRAWATQRTLDAFVQTTKNFRIEGEAIYLGPNTFPENGRPDFSREEMLDIFPAYSTVQIKLLDAIVETLASKEGYIRIELNKDDLKHANEIMDMTFQQLIDKYNIACGLKKKWRDCIDLCREKT